MGQYSQGNRRAKMNERIKDLAIQAGKLDQFGPEVWSDNQVEKLVELVIRECAAVTDAAEDSTPHLTFGDHLLSHFGIEK